MASNNDYLNDIASKERGIKRTNNQLLEAIAASGSTGGGGGLTPEQIEKLNSVDNKADLVDGIVPESQLPPAVAGLELGEDSTTAYRGDHGKIAFDHTSRQDNPHNVTAQQVGLDSEFGYAELDAAGVVKQEQINISGLGFKGAWNAEENLPVITDGEGQTGDFYKVSHAGTQNFGNGTYAFNVGDWVMFAAGVWQRIGVHENVVSVNGKIGAVTITKEDLDIAMVDNTSDMDKPVSTATALALADKSDVGHTHEISDVVGLQDALDAQRGVLVAERTSTGQFSTLTLTIPEDAPDLLRFELYSPELTTAAAVRMTMNEDMSQSYKTVSHSVNSLEYTIFRHMQYSGIRMLGRTGDNAQSGNRHGLRITGTMTNVAGQPKIVRGSSFMNGTGSATHPDVLEFHGSCNSVAVVNNKITQIQFSFPTSSNFAIGTWIRVYGIS